jgi:hypothetical protein
MKHNNQSLFLPSIPTRPRRRVFTPDTFNLIRVIDWDNTAPIDYPKGLNFASVELQFVHLIGGRFVDAIVQRPLLHQSFISYSGDGPLPWEELNND